MIDIAALHQALEEVCPIHGVDNTGRIDFKEEATHEQRTAARAIFENWNQAALDQAKADQRAARLALQAEAKKAQTDPKANDKERIDALEKQVAWLMERVDKE